MAELVSASCTLGQAVPWESLSLLEQVGREAASSGLEVGGDGAGLVPHFLKLLCQAPLNLASPSGFTSKQQACWSCTRWLSSVCPRPWQWTSAFTMGAAQEPGLSAGLRAIHQGLLSERKKPFQHHQGGGENPLQLKSLHGVTINGALSSHFFFPGRWISFIFHQKHITFLLSNEADAWKDKVKYSTPWWSPSKKSLQQLEQTHCTVTAKHSSLMERYLLSHPGALC